MLSYELSKASGLFDGRQCPHGVQKVASSNLVAPIQRTRWPLEVTGPSEFVVQSNPNPASPFVSGGS